MKKSIAVILLSSALLVPNQHAEAAYSSKEVKVIPVHSIEYIGWTGLKANYPMFDQYKGYSFYKKWIDFACKYMQQGKPLPEVPKEELPGKPELPGTPETPGKPETPEVPGTPELPGAPGAPEKPEKPEVPETPEVEDDEIEQLPEVEEKPEVDEPNIEEKPEVKPPSEIVPDEPENEENSNAMASAIEREILNLTNNERQKAGLSPLALDDKLMNSARAKSKDMATQNYFSHTSPTYGSPFDQMKQFGVSYRAAAENIAMGQRSAEEVVRAWMNSPGHRQNILTGSFTHIGIGYDANGHYWTQQFIQK